MPGPSAGVLEVDGPEAAAESADWQAQVGRLVRRERLARGWSQGELARRAGTDQRMVSRIENGAQAHPESRALLAMSVVLVLQRGDLAEAIGIGHYLELDHHVPDMDEPRIKRLYRHLGKLPAADQWLAIGIFEQLVNRFRAGDGRRMVHVTATMLLARAALDLLSDGRLDGVIRFTMDMCSRARGVL